MKYILTLLLLTMSGCICSCSSGHGSTDLKIFVIGDSISIGYTQFLPSELPASYTVKHTTENAENSNFTRENLDHFLDEAGCPNNCPDVITWNNGIWDCKHIEMVHPDFLPDEYFTTDDEYRANLINIGTRLKATGSRIVFFTTTYIPNDQGGWLDQAHVYELNQIAKETLPGLGIEVVDLFDVNGKDLSLYQANGYDPHFTDHGYKNLAAEVAETILNE